MIHLPGRKGRASPVEASGQSMTEIAVLAPLLMLILLGALDLGRVFFAYVAITNASREGARYGMTNSTDSNYINDIAGAATREAGGVLVFSGPNANSTIDVECAAPGSNPTNAASYRSCTSTAPQPGGSVQVTVSYPFQFATLYLFGVSSTTISDYTRMAIIQ
jgi:Flp pilus assembly protein TadG